MKRTDFALSAVAILIIAGFLTWTAVRDANSNPDYASYGQPAQTK